MSRIEGPPWKDVVRLWANSADLDLHALEAGRDLVIEAPRSQAHLFPPGVLLDDLLSNSRRDDLDSEAGGALSRWRRRRDQNLTLEGVCLPEIWEVELLAEVFIPETRIVSGVAGSLAADRKARRVECSGLDRGRFDCLRQVLAPARIELVAPTAFAPPPSYPGILAAPVAPPRWRKVARSLALTPGIPPRVRGTVYILPYWHLVPLIQPLAEATELKLVLDPGAVLRTSPRVLLRAARTGGWIGKPGLLARKHSRRALESAVESARRSSRAENPLDGHLDQRALDMLGQRATETVASALRLRRSFRGSRIRVAVVPFDTPPDARLIVRAAREAGAASLVVQHGFTGAHDDPDKTFSSAAAVWSNADAESLQGRTAGRVVRTGNPGIDDADALLRRVPTIPSSGHTVILVEYQLRLSTRFDSRLSVHHVITALEGVAGARPGSRVTIRPHPAEHEPEIFESVAREFGSSLEVRVDTKSPIADVIAQADLLVAAVSTATLQAAAAGVPVVFLNVTGRTAPWPFDGSTEVPLATSADELAEQIPELLERGVKGRQVMMEALGVDANAARNTVDLIRELAEGPQ